MNTQHYIHISRKGINFAQAEMYVPGLDNPDVRKAPR